MIVYTTGDLLHCECEVIVHQINAVTVTAKGLASSIQAHWPWAAPYAHRRAHHKSKWIADPEDWSSCGTIEVRENPTKGAMPVAVIGIVGQKRPGKSMAQIPSAAEDSYEQRAEWFMQGLRQLTEWLLEHHVTTVGFPKGIGCGLAGGNPARYNKMLQAWACTLPETTTAYSEVRNKVRAWNLRVTKDSLNPHHDQSPTTTVTCP